MFQAIINRAQRATSAVFSHYLARAAVMVPFVIAAGFATAAITTKLTELYGAVSAYILLGCGFTLIGAIVAIAVADKAPPPISAAEPEAEPIEVETSTSQATGSVNPELILTALGALGPRAIGVVARSVGRNIPLVVGLAAVTYLLIAEAAQRERSTANEPAE